MIRRLRPGCNPLRRTADGVEAAVMATLTRWQQVPAVLLQDAPEPAQALSQASLEPLVRAPDSSLAGPGQAAACRLGRRLVTHRPQWTGRL